MKIKVDFGLMYILTHVFFEFGYLNNIFERTTMALSCIKNRTGSRLNFRAETTRNFLGHFKSKLLIMVIL